MTIETQQVADDVDLSSYTAFADGVPYEVFDRMRASDPVRFFEQSDRFGPFWSITSHEHVVEVTKDHQTFTSGEGIMGVRLRLAPAKMIEEDRPAHTAVRQLIAKPFTAKAVLRSEELARKVVREAIADVRGRETFDLVDELAFWLPNRVIIAMVGVDQVDRDEMIELMNGILHNDTGTPEGIERGRAIEGRLREITDELHALRSRRPTADIATLLVQAGVDTNEFFDYVSLVIAAGSGTTKTLVARGTLLLLQGDGVALDAMLADPSLIPTAVEEMLRYNPSVLGLLRHASRDVTLGGHRISEGDRVMMWFAAANRDPDVFVDPHRFDIRRSPNPHLSFGGGGIHHCLGASLARLEARVFFEEFAPLIPKLELAGTVTEGVTPQDNLIMRAPLRWTT